MKTGHACNHDHKPKRAESPSKLQSGHGHGHDHSPAKPKQRKIQSEMSSEDFETANGSIDYDNIIRVGEENRRNVILVGTKLDLVKKNPEKRQVEFKEAKALAAKLKLAAVTELSSKEDITLGE